MLRKVWPRLQLVTYIAVSDGIWSISGRLYRKECEAPCTASRESSTIFVGNVTIYILTHILGGNIESVSERAVTTRSLPANRQTCRKGRVAGGDYRSHSRRYVSQHGPIFAEEGVDSSAKSLRVIHSIPEEAVAIAARTVHL